MCFYRKCTNVKISVCIFLLSLPTRERGLKYRRGFAHTQLSLSLPTRERGLKSCNYRRIDFVTRSLPTRERGLKSTKYIDENAEMLVAPYTGAWIEMLLDNHTYYVVLVAPYTGAWIEIFMR